MRLSRIQFFTVAAAAGVLSVAVAQTEKSPANIPHITIPPATTTSSVRKIPLRPVSPVSYFRGLLGMKPAERERVLAGESPEQKKALLAKIKEYEAMPADERELRLRMTQLRWYLLDLMKLPPLERVPHLNSMPPEDRALVKNRLRQWDEIPPHLQKQFLEHESAISLFLRLQSSTPAARQRIMEGFTPDKRKQVESELARWQSLPATQQKDMTDQFRQFFELTDKEKQKALSTLSEAERQQMERTLQEFGKLTADQRRQCISSFEKFANMAPQERAQFLKNAERWQAMTPNERQSWRDLVQKLPEMPPMPPSWGQTLPPMPPSIKVPPPSPMIASTNAIR